MFCYEIQFVNIKKCCIFPVCLFFSYLTDLKVHFWLVHILPISPLPYTSLWRFISVFFFLCWKRSVSRKIVFVRKIIFSEQPSSCQSSSLRNRIANRRHTHGGLNDGENKKSIRFSLGIGEENKSNENGTDEAMV